MTAGQGSREAGSHSPNSALTVCLLCSVTAHVTVGLYCSQSCKFAHVENKEVVPLHFTHMVIMKRKCTQSCGLLFC